jgi:transposase-like protein
MFEKFFKNQRLLCPNIKCELHHALRSQDSTEGAEKSQPSCKRSFKCNGSYSVRASFGCHDDLTRRQRFRCLRCGRTFSETFFSLEYRYQRQQLNAPIFRYFSQGLSNHQIARLLGVSERVVRWRLRRIAQQSLLIHAHKTRGLNIREPISYDGVENFAKSQYEPNNIQQAIGMKSLFIYDFNFAPLNRKGRMSDRQRQRKAQIEQAWGTFDRDAIRKSTAQLLLRLVQRCPAHERLVLATDQHFQYRRAIERDLKPHIRGRIDHATISSKASRVYKHILFPVNHADLLLRQHVKAFARETISFSKTHGAMVQKYAIFMVYKNYIRPKFTKVQKRDPTSNLNTPAMSAKVESAPLSFEQFFSQRMLPTQVELPEEWKLFFHGQVGFSRSKTLGIE